MASVLDLGLVEYFIPIIVFLFVMVVLWALLEKTGFFSKQPWVNLLLSFCLAALFIIVPGISEVITLSLPWFIVLFIFLLFLILTFLFMGVNPDVVSGVFGSNIVVFWAILIISLGIFGFAFTQVYGEQIHDITSTDTTTEDGDLVQNIGQILFTPKILGFLLLIVIAGFGVRFISANTS
ncbi:hypothetical protein HN681_04575 [archaeon]|jgi:hypothetical protein|nr:hypothetical protein [archaeon]MBT3730982.1 hypothetical protein [archaeon]MBT4669780.1 hypothetical protein [archaeon]MBT5029930.1 hypothetical protein [archaeon]MBT5288502.1 hypothetical protein [archaeon]